MLILTPLAIGMRKAGRALCSKRLRPFRTKLSYHHNPSNFTSNALRNQRVFMNPCVLEGNLTKLEDSKTRIYPFRSISNGGSVKRLSLVFSTLVILFFIPGNAISQYSPGIIDGIIRGSDGKPVAGAKICVLHDESGIEDGVEAQTVSDSEGRFTFFFINPGRTILHFDHDSMEGTAAYKTRLYPGQILRLEVQAGKAREVPVAPVSWKAEKVLAEEWMDVFPNTKHIWAFLNHSEPSVVAERYDVSGMHGHRQFLLGVRGSSYTQNPSDIDGIDISSPDGNGMLAFPDFAAMKSVVYTVGDSMNQHLGTGAHLSLIPKTGGRRMHGEARLFFQSGALQNTNPTERMQFFGITDSDERWRRFINTDFQLGGPVGQKSWTYFGAISLRDQEKYIREQILPVSATVVQETMNLSGSFSEKNRLSVYWAAQQLSEPQAYASPQVTREATVDQDRRYQTLRVGWTRSMSPRTLIDVRFGIVSGDIHSRAQPGTDTQNTEELFPGFTLYGMPDTPNYLDMVDRLNNTISGAPSLIPNSGAAAIQGRFGFSTVRDGFGKSNHRISAGVAFRRASLTQRYSAIDNINLLFFERVPESVRLLNTPVKTRDRIHHLEFHVADTISFSRLSIGIGAYTNISNGANLPDSGSSTNSLTWKNLSGRVGLAYDPWKNRRLVFRAGLARIYHQPLTRTWTAVNPSGLGIQRHSWVDENGDRLYQPGEDMGVLKVYGAPYSRLDPGLRNPHMNEVNVGFSSEIISGISFHLFGFRRTEKNLMSLVNEGVPFSSYTPVQVLDPGPDGDLNAVDDNRMVTAYNQDPETLGEDRYVLTNPDGHTGNAEGYEIKVGFSFHRFQAEASVMRYRAVAATAPGMLAVQNDTSALLGIYDDPNKAILARGSTYFDRGTVARFWAVYDLFWGIRWAPVISYQDGLPSGRCLPVSGFNQGVFGILVRQRGPGDPGSVGGYMTKHYRNFDSRISKEFSWGTGRLAAVVDIFNIENRAGGLLQTDVTAPTHLWRIPLRFQTPRSIQLGVHYRW